MSVSAIAVFLQAALVPLAGPTQPQEFPIFTGRCALVDSERQIFRGSLDVFGDGKNRQIELKLISDETAEDYVVKVSSKPIAKANSSTGVYGFEETGRTTNWAKDVWLMIEALGPRPETIQVTVASMPSLASPKSLVFNAPTLVGLCKNESVSTEVAPQ